jgi:hypothetical protein
LASSLLDRFHYRAEFAGSTIKGIRANDMLKIHIPYRRQIRSLGCIFEGADLASFIISKMKDGE